ncbi:zinc finger protein 891 isoform X2 [Drosophila grimshawi]|uniref:zinc finger protein 891 isoform X2 n=1 Tax=Drosophila grimshawi TaxID=7222 RepID=UPI0013EF37E5|nr:zinc finger protein 891 isoform X2 [Drosophila grimshawi]
MKAVGKNNNSNICETCGKCFLKPALLHRHLVVHSRAKFFACNRCCSQFTQKSSLRRHLRTKHDEVNDSDSSQVAQQALAALKALQVSHTIVANKDVQTPLEEQQLISCQVVQVKDALNPRGELHFLPTQRVQRRQQRVSYFYVCDYCSKEFSKTYDLIRETTFIICGFNVEALSKDTKRL